MALEDSAGLFVAMLLFLNDRRSYSICGASKKDLSVSSWRVLHWVRQVVVACIDVDLLAPQVALTNMVLHVLMERDQLSRSIVLIKLLLSSCSF
jgi:hypothetical protein